MLGGGAWGTALALTAHRAGSKTTLWIREKEIANSIKETGINPFLPGIHIPDSIHVTHNLKEAVEQTDCILLTVPSQFVRDMARQCELFLSPETPILICSKGIEENSGKLMTEVVADEMPGRSQAVLSGPSFAREVALEQPTAVTIATECTSISAFDCSDNLAIRAAFSLTTNTFKPYVSDDPTGVEIGGAVKNVIAIACGMADGLGYRSNTRAALITRGLSEINQLAMAMGARPETLSGLAGMGDLSLTCSDQQSRNFSFGRNYATETTCTDRMESAPVVEGIRNARSVIALAKRLNVKMPICEMVNAVVHDGIPLTQAMEGLWKGPVQPEAKLLETQFRLTHTSREKSEGQRATQ